MKPTLFVAAALLLCGSAFTSCKKCYQCTTTVVYDDVGLGTPAKSTQTHEFCGTKKEKKDRENEMSGTSTVSLGGITFTQHTDTECK